MEKGIFSILLSAVFFMTVGGLAVWLGVWLFSGAKQVIAFLPTAFQDFVFPFLEEGFAWIEELFILTDSSEIEFLEGSFENILTALSSRIILLSNAALSAVAVAATKIPGAFMRTVITVIATVFLTIDFDKVSGFFLSQITEKQKAIMQEAKGYFGGILLKCIASYGLIFLDIGSFFDRRFAGERVPLLSEVIAFAKENGIKLNYHG